MRPCTSRTRPAGAPRWYRCERERGHGGDHEGGGRRWEGVRGRPPSGESETIAVRVPVAVAAALDERAEAKGQTRTEYVRALLVREAGK